MPDVDDTSTLSPDPAISAKGTTVIPAMGALVESGDEAGEGEGEGERWSLGWHKASCVASDTSVCG